MLVDFQTTNETNRNTEVHEEQINQSKIWYNVSYVKHAKCWWTRLAKYCWVKQDSNTLHVVYLSFEKHSTSTLMK